MKIEAVIFDFFGTLVDDFAASAGQMSQEMAVALAMPYEQFTEIWRQTAEMRIIGAFETVEANIRYVCDAMKVEPASEQIAKAVEIRMKYMRRMLKPRPDAIKTANQLKSQNYKIGLISNCSIEIPILWQETAFAKAIDTPIFSSREHLRKPDTRIYQLACERLGTGPEACLYLADGEDHELAAAAKVGLHPVLLQTPGRNINSRSLQEAREWRGVAISSLPEVLGLVKS